MTTTQMTATKFEPTRDTVAKLIRADLKAAFPGVKFSVTSERSTVNVSWSMGPSAGAVEALIGKYEAGHFDGSEDCYKFRQDDPGHPTVMYIFTRRDTSSVEEQVARDICASYGVAFAGMNTYLGFEYVDAAVYRALRDADLTDGYHGVEAVDGTIRAKAAPASMRAVQAALTSGPEAANDNGAGCEPDQAPSYAAQSSTASVSDAGKRPRIASAADVASHCRDIASEDREHFVVFDLDVRHRVLARRVVAIGALTGVEVHPREVFKGAVIASAASVILVHNHPSGDTTPSRQDLEMTKRLQDAGELLGIAVLDHVVVGSDGWTSLAERGWR